MNLQKAYALKDLNTFGVDVEAKFFSVFESTDELTQLLDKVGENDDLLILGGGSNILFTEDYKGYVFKNNIKGIEKVKESDGEVVLKVGGGVVWHEFVLYCIENDFGGVENMSLIPGTVGAAPIQNVGAYGVEQKDVFEKLEALNMATKKVEVFDTERCEFGYRDSFFKQCGKGRYVITNVFYRLSKKNHKLNTSYGTIKKHLKQNDVVVPTLRDISRAVIEIRQSRLPDPTKIGNAGSFFKNPVISKDQFEKAREKYPDIVSVPVDETKVKVPAGWLIEKAGWKGITCNETYGVYKHHSLVLVNYGGARGKEIKKLALSIMRDIELKFGIELEAEVVVI